MDAKILNTIGLVLNIAGGTLWFFYGFPQPTHEEGIALGLEDATELADGRTVAEQDEEIRRTKYRYRLISQSALVLIILGFIFQLWATWS